MQRILETGNFSDYYSESTSNGLSYDELSRKAPLASNNDSGSYVSRSEATRSTSAKASSCFPASHSASVVARSLPKGALSSVESPSDGDVRGVWLARSAGREAEVERMQRIVQDCLAAVATGDVDSLEACIAEAKHETQTHETDLGLRAHSVACEAEAEMVLEDCLQAIADGDIDELRACLLEASSAVEGEGDE
eukprot:jgi/Pico_ML_1/52030/g2804.t2